MSEGPVCDVLLTEEQLHYLGRYAQGEPSACSPFYGVTPPETLPPAALDDLARRELLGPEGVEPRLLWTLELVKAAPACGGLSVRADAPQAELACYLSGEYSASLINTARGLRLVSPLPAGDLLILLEDVLGTGSRREATFSAELPAAESRALAGALDLMRRDALRWTLDDRGEPLREDALAAWLSRGEWAAQWLTPHLGALLDRRGRGFDAAGVGGAIGGLVDRGLFSRAAAELVPSAEVAALVRPLALLDRVVELRAVREEAGTPIAAAEVVLIRAHSPALLLWELGPGGSVQWLTPTPAEAGELAARLVTNGDALGSLSDPGRP